MTDALRMGDVVELRPDAASPVGTLFGYFARFNEPAEINNPVEGHFIERLSPGAFSKTLADRGYDPRTGLMRAEGGQHVPVLFHHGLDPAIGMRPLGVPSVMRQDETGVYGEVPLDDTSYNRDLAASLRSGALGQSFRFKPIAARDKWTRSASGPPEVMRHEVVLREFGPTPIPAYSGANASIRAGDLPDLRFPDGALSIVRFLVDAEDDPELDALFPEIRAGKTLSEPNAALVRKAHEAITALMGHAGEKPEPNETPAQEAAETPSEETAEQADGSAEARAALMALKRKRMNAAQTPTLLKINAPIA